MLKKVIKNKKFF